MLNGTYYLVKLETREGTKWYNREEEMFLLDEPTVYNLVTMDDIRHFNLTTTLWGSRISYYKVETSTSKVNIP